MKSTYYFLFELILLFNCTLSFAQEGEKQKYISPVIGDSLDESERDFYKLFPNVKNFIGAVFYLEDNISLSAKVYHQEGNQLKFNTYKNYMAGLQNFNRYTEQIDKVSASTPGGKEITIFLANDKVITGELISASQNSILIFPLQDGINLIDDIDLITLISKDSIYKLILPNQRSDFDNCLVSSYTGGAILGVLTGTIASIASNNESGQNATPALIALIGWAIGTVITYFIISEDIELSMSGEYDFSELNENARFKNFVPFYLKNMK